MLVRIDSPSGRETVVFRIDALGPPKESLDRRPARARFRASTNLWISCEWIHHGCDGDGEIFLVLICVFVKRRGDKVKASRNHLLVVLLHKDVDRVDIPCRFSGVHHVQYLQTRSEVHSFSQSIRW